MKYFSVICGFLAFLFVAHSILKRPIGARFTLDTPSYIHGSVTRGPFYHGIVAWLVAKEHRKRSLANLDPKGYRNLVIFQRVVAVVSVAFFVAAASLTFPLGGLALLITFLSLHLLIGPWNNWLTRHLSEVMTEGLAHAWLFFMLGLLFLVMHPFKRALRIPLLVSIGVLGFAGVELAPRLLFFWFLCAVPKSRIPLLVFSALVLLRCSYTFVQHGTFSTLPYGGFQEIGTVLTEATPQDVEIFTDPVQKSFFERAIHHPERMTGGASVEKNVWSVAFPVFQTSPGGSDNKAKANRFFHEVSMTWLKHRGWRLKNRLDFIISSFTHYLQKNPRVAITGVLLLALCPLTLAPHRKLMALLTLGHFQFVFLMLCLASPIHRYWRMSAFLLIGPIFCIVLNLVGRLIKLAALRIPRPLPT